MKMKIKKLGDDYGSDDADTLHRCPFLFFHNSFPLLLFIVQFLCLVLLLLGLISWRDRSKGENSK